MALLASLLAATFGQLKQCLSAIVPRRVTILGVGYFAEKVGPIS
jgi:hypothetical protein